MKRALRLLALVALAGCANGLDPQTPRLYACDRSAGLNSCPGGWRCGLSGYCQNPDQPLPYACESSEDCSLGWRCGQELLCYDRAAARDRACRLELEGSPDTSDCAPGWRCGREPRGVVCHPLGAGAGYQCERDEDCEADWRCGVDGVCVDVAAQGLTGAPDVQVSIARVNPLLPTQVDLLQLRLRAPSSGVSETNQLAFTSGGTLNVVSPGPLGDDLSSTLSSTPLLRAGHALARTNEHLLVTDSTGLVDYVDAFDGGSARVVLPALANAELRYAPAFAPFGVVSAKEELATFSGSEVGICGHVGSIDSCDPSSFEFSTLPAPIRDVTFLDEDTTSRRSALAVTAEGPFFAPRQGPFLSLDGGLATGPLWRRMALPGLSDACAATPVPLDRVAYDVALRVLAVTSDQDRRLSLFTRPFTPQVISPCEELAVDPAYGPCSACGPGETLVQLGSDRDATQANPSIVALCQRAEADGGTSLATYLHRSTDGGCSLDPLPLAAGVKHGYRVARQTFGLQGLDGTGSPRACPQPGCDTMLFSRAPDRVAGGPALLQVHTDDLVDEGGHHAQPSGVATALGLQQTQFSSLYVAGSVVEEPDWMIGSSGSAATMGAQTMVIQSMSRWAPGPLNQAFAYLNRSSDLLPSVAAGGLGLVDASATKAFGTVTVDADGRPWLIVGAGDRIWAEDARLLGPDAGLKTINVKTVPMPSADIQSLAFGPYDRGDAGTGPLLEGYTVEQNRLFRVRVHSAQLWLPDEIRIGETGIVPVAVWMEGKRGRVGTSDGRVFGLPIPVPLSPTIPEAPLPTVLNYSSLCGQAFALSPTALYRLSSDTQPLGTWKRVSLESAHPGLDSFGPHWSATLHKARVGDVEHLYLFSDTGLAIVLSATCAQ